MGKVAQVAKMAALSMLPLLSIDFINKFILQKAIYKVKRIGLPEQFLRFVHTIIPNRFFERWRWLPFAPHMRRQV
jgi:hypothetical protein